MTDCSIGDTGGGPRRGAPTWRWLPVALCCLVLVGCAGGSGSSGFDIAAAENRAIATALADATCVVERGLTICASGSGEASGTPTATPPTTAPGATATVTPPGQVASPTPTATAGPSQPEVDVALDPADVAACASADSANPCSVRLVFVPMAVPAGSAYRAAVRQRDPDGPWRIMTVTANEVVIDVEPDVMTLQSAILVYPSDPGPVPVEVAVLSDSGADFAFVTPPFAVRGGDTP